MPNLLLEEKKKEIFREFVLRFIIVFLTFLFFTFCVLIILIIPSYMLSQVKEVGITNDVRIFKETIDFRGNNSPTHILERERTKLDILQKPEEIKISELIHSVVSDKPQDIKINRFFYEKNVNTAKPVKNEKTESAVTKIKLIVNGVAKERTALIDFINRLKLEDDFLDVHSPVSNLLRGESIDFSIDILIKNNN